MSRRLAVPLILLVLASAAPAAAQQRPYTEGRVVFTSFIRTKPGMFERYMRYLAGPYKQLMEEQKKTGIIDSWSVRESSPRGPDDWNVLLVVTYKNMAALDGLDDRTEPILQRVIGSQDQRDQGAISRQEMREVLGGRLSRELILK